MNNWSSIRSEHDIFSDTGRGPHTQVRHHVWSGLKGARLWRDTTAAEQTAGAPARTPYNDCLHYCLPGMPDIFNGRLLALLKQAVRTFRQTRRRALVASTRNIASWPAGATAADVLGTRSAPRWMRLCSVLSSCTQSDRTAGS